MRHGIDLPDGRTRPVNARLLSEQPAPNVEMVLPEGRNRQIRRMWWRLGYRVRRLVRVAIGGFELGDLPTGGSKVLGESEIKRLLQPGNEERFHAKAPRAQRSRRAE